MICELNNLADNIPSLKTQTKKKQSRYPDLIQGNKTNKLRMSTTPADNGTPKKVELSPNEAWLLSNALMHHKTGIATADVSLLHSLLSITITNLHFLSSGLQTLSKHHLWK